jgi:hypothetical protein
VAIAGFDFSGLSQWAHNELSAWANGQTRGTLQIGLGGSGTLTIPGTPFSFSFHLSGGAMIDTHLDVGLYGTGGFGPTATGAGDSVNGGLTAQVSDALTIDNLSGRFDNFSIGAGDVVGGSIDGFYGPSPNGAVIGGGLTLGAGEGLSGTVMQTDTGVCTTSGGCHF